MTMNAQELARMMLDRLGDLANYALGDEALDYLESIRVELRPIAWPEYAALWAKADAEEAQATRWAQVGVGLTQKPDGFYVYEEPFIEARGGPYETYEQAAIRAEAVAAALLDAQEEGQE